MKKIKGRIFDIFCSKWVLKFVDEIVDKDNGEVIHYGRTDNIKYEILINNNQPDNEKEITFYHELIHAILNTGQYFEYSSNEAFVEYMARCIYSLKHQGILDGDINTNK